MSTTSFVCSHFTGYMTNRMNMFYTTIWTDSMNTAGEIVFYGTLSEPRSIKNVIDIQINQGQTITIGVYPHNTRDLFTEILKPDNRMDVELLVAELRHKYPDRVHVTIDLDDMSEVTEESFSHYNPGCLTEGMGYVGFIFKGVSSPEKAFPTIFVMEHRKNEDQIRSFPIQVWSSRWMYTPTKTATTLGKQITYMLINSSMKGEFKGVTPHINAMNFPSMPEGKLLPKFLGALEAFIESSGAKNIKNVGGTVIDANPPEQPTEPASVFFGNENPKTIADAITTEVINKGHVSFSNLAGLGVFETITLIGKTEKPVEVLMDMTGFARRMCIFEGYVYAVPYDDQESAESLKEELGEFLVLCTLDDIPLVLHKSTLLN